MTKEFSKKSKIRRLENILKEAIEIIEDYKFFKDNKLMINILAYVLEKSREVKIMEQIKIIEGYVAYNVEERANKFMEDYEIIDVQYHHAIERDKIVHLVIIRYRD